MIAKVTCDSMFSCVCWRLSGFLPGSQSLSASGDRVFFPGLELVVQLVDGWFLEIEVGEVTLVWEEHLSFLMDIWNIFLCWVV